MFKNYISLLIFFTLITFQASAVEVVDLYKVKLAVKSQAKSQRSQAYKQGLSTVLVKIAGKQEILQDSIIIQALKQPTKYLVRYQYDNSDAEQLRLQLEYSAEGINNLLRSNSYSIWGSHRPLTLIWLVTESGLERNLMSEDSSLYLDLVKTAADLRGLPVIAPLLDFEDAMNIQVSDVWGQFEQPILEASQRYQPDIVTSIKISTSKMEQNPLSADWSATVKLFKGEELYSVELIAGDQELLIQKSINWLADQLGSMYAVAAQAYQTESEFLHITFKNVPNMKTLITIEAFLSSLPAVNNSTIYEINEYGVEFRIKLLGESLDVFNALSLDDRIDKIKVSFGETLPVQNYFSWKGRTR